MKKENLFRRTFNKAEMTKFGRQLISFTPRQFILMIVGHIILALGLGIFAASDIGAKAITIGIHPFHSMFFGAEALLKNPLFTYALLQIYVDVILFVIEFFWGRHYIGIGALVNTFCLGLLVTLCTNFMTAVILWFEGLFGLTQMTLAMQLVLLVLGTIVIALGLSIYQAADAGIAPYDAMPIMLSKKTKIPFFWCRIFVDGLCFIVTLLVHGNFGPGTVVTVFCTGPFVHFFDKHLTAKIVAPKGEPAAQ